jgi:uncharacterized membrane protein
MERCGGNRKTSVWQCSAAACILLLSLSIHQLASVHHSLLLHHMLPLLLLLPLLLRRPM